MNGNGRKGIFRVVIFIITTPFVVTFNIVYAWFTQRILDSLPMETGSMIKWLFMVVGVLLLYTLMILVGSWNATYMIKEYSNGLKEKIYSEYFRRVDVIQTSESISSAINHDIAVLEDEYYGAIQRFLYAALQLVLSLAVVLTVNAWYGLLLCVMMGLPMIFASIFGRNMNLLNTELQSEKERYTSFLAEAKGGKETVLSYHILGPVLEKHKLLANALSLLNIGKKNKLAQSKIINQNFSRCMGALGTLIGFYMVSLGQISLGWVMAFTQLSSSITYPIASCIQEWIQIRGSQSLKKGIREKCKATEEETCQKDRLSSVNVKNACESTVLLDCSIVNYSINENRILGGLEFQLNQGEKMLITGENGSGKSTLIKILLGLITKYEGIVRWNFEKAEETEEGIKDRIAYVSQKPFLFDGTVKENIILDLPYESERYINACKTARVKTESDKRIGNGYENLSGGEKQRIALARAIYSGRKILVLDEPYSFLDQQDLIRIENKILTSDVFTVITISHAIPEENRKYYHRELSLAKIYS